MLPKEFVEVGHCARVSLLVIKLEISRVLLHPRNQFFIEFMSINECVPSYYRRAAYMMLFTLLGSSTSFLRKCRISHNVPVANPHFTPGQGAGRG